MRLHHLAFALAASTLAASTVLAAPLHLDPTPADPLRPDRGIRTNAPPRASVLGTGAIEIVEPPTLPCPGLVGFGDVAAATPPGTSYDQVFESGGSDFGERFAGQSVSTLGGFDALSGAASGPLALVAGAAGANLAVMDYLGDHVLAPLGAAGFPAFTAVGEGAFAMRFDYDQSHVAFDVVGGDGGHAIVTFYRRDGGTIDAIALSSLTDRRYAFRRAGGLREIAGFTVTNDDLAGIAVDDVCHDVPGVTGPPIDCSQATASPSMLWPPNHELVPVAIAGLGTASVRVLAVTHDDPSRVQRAHCPDARIDQHGRLWLRAERTGHGGGRTYVVTFEATPEGGGPACTGRVTVCVPRTPNGACTPGTAANDALAPCRSQETRGSGVSLAELDAMRLELVTPSRAGLEHLRLTLPRPAAIELAVYDVGGRRLAVVERGFRGAGVHDVSWDASALRTGLYVYRLGDGTRAVTRKRFVVR